MAIGTEELFDALTTMCKGVCMTRMWKARALTAASILAALTTLSAFAQKPAYKVLHKFTGPPADAAHSGASLIRDPQGNLYGTTEGGGVYGIGAVFKLGSNGTETLLYSFTGEADGGTPVAGLVRDAEGNLYGTTAAGGIDACSPNNYCGVVFKLDTTGTETVLYRFTGGVDGAVPYGGLVRDSVGNLYGTTYRGGASDAGVVFKLDTSGQETVLYAFTGGTDGGFPMAGLLRDSGGNLYGTTAGGAGPGGVFKLDTAGKETVLYSFSGGADGSLPYGGLVRDSLGNLYGTTMQGGLTTGGSPGGGVVFKVDSAGNETVIYAFTGSRDGFAPYAGVVRDPAGNLYGTTYYGGDQGRGVVFKVDPAGTETVLHTFGGADGATSVAGLILDSKGNLYGTTQFGGTARNGVVFKIMR
jgi:uncharacterized repeat protein (TIGR03803 family)